jgi:4-hydroxy-tetrahydrodipicolinate synthase
MTVLFDKNAWRGVWTALVTPLKIENAQLTIDVQSLEQLIERQLESQALSGFVIAGSTGEGSLLNSKNYSLLLGEAKRIVAGRVPLVAGIGIGGTEASLAAAKIVKSYGYDAILASPPAYVKSPQRGLVEHYKALAFAELPICIYEVAGRAASSIDINTIAELLNCAPALSKHFVAVKDASGDLVRALKSSELLGTRVALLSGDDFSLQPFLCAGGSGVISVASHVIPKRMKKICDLVQSGKILEAAQEQSRCLPLIEALFWESNPIPVKSLLTHNGTLKKSIFCSPLVPMQEQKLVDLAKLYQSLGDA